MISDHVWKNARSIEDVVRISLCSIGASRMVFDGAIFVEGLVRMGECGNFGREYNVVEVMDILSEYDSEKISWFGNYWRSKDDLISLPDTKFASLPSYLLNQVLRSETYDCLYNGILTKHHRLISHHLSSYYLTISHSCNAFLLHEFLLNFSYFCNFLHRSISNSQS